MGEFEWLCSPVCRYALLFKSNNQNYEMRCLILIKRTSFHSRKTLEFRSFLLNFRFYIGLQGYWIVILFTFNQSNRLIYRLFLLFLDGINITTWLRFPYYTTKLSSELHVWIYSLIFNNFGFYLTHLFQVWHSQRILLLLWNHKGKLLYNEYLKLN